MFFGTFGLFAVVNAFAPDFDAAGLPAEPVFTTSDAHAGIAQDDHRATNTYDSLVDARARELSERFALSERESQILARLLRGYSTAAIRNELVIAKGTVDTHIQRIYRKCDVHSRQELVELAEKVTASLS